MRPSFYDTRGKNNKKKKDSLCIALVWEEVCVCVCAALP